MGVCTLRRNGIQFGKLGIEGLVAVCHLKGTQDGIFRMGQRGRDQRLQGPLFQPGILVEQIDIVISVLQGIIKSQIVRLGKS